LRRRFGGAVRSHGAPRQKRRSAAIDVAGQLKAAGTGAAGRLCFASGIDFALAHHPPFSAPLHFVPKLREPL
jgi:hypothetical protein